MQKTFNVWVKRYGYPSFWVCSHQVIGDGNRLTKIDKDDSIIHTDGAMVHGCDISKWLKTFDMEINEVRSFKLTLTVN